MAESAQEAAMRVILPIAAEAAGMKCRQFVVTFPVGGPLADRFCTIVAADEISARLAVIGVYGQSGWAGIYPDDHAQSMIEKYELTEVPLGTDRLIAQDYAS